MNKVTLTPARLADEICNILKTLEEKSRAGMRLRLTEARSSLARNLSLDFADYFKFMKLHNYVFISRNDQSLSLTDEGRKLLEKGASEAFLNEIQEDFKELLNQQESELIDMDEEAFAQVEKRLSPAPAAPPARPAAPAAAEKVEAAPAAKGSKGEAPYTRYEALGSGGIGTVFRAKHNALGLAVAIKEIKELFTYFNFLQRSEVVRQLREAVSQMASLNHPLVVRIFDINTEVAYPFFVMEYLSGGNLKDEISRGPLGEERSLVLFLQMVYALRAAHQQQIVHGNLKPENVLFDEQGNVRLCDFGMVRLLKTESDRPLPQLITGSIAYLSPEQLKERTVQTVSSDIYSLGVIFYEMLTGHIPGRRSPLPSQAVKGLSPALDDLFEKMTLDDPAQRIPDLEAVLDEFYKHFSGGKYLEKNRLVLYCQKAAAKAE
jgi:hypothetical protein